jgi:hypothetical protein
MDFLQAALSYHGEGLCVIPVKPGGKAPALASWERYQTTRSTEDEVRAWFGNGRSYNVGIVHGEVSGNYVTLDVDHDAGIYAMMQDTFPKLFDGRLEQSGSGGGYHISLRVDRLPDFGTHLQRPRGNRTWKTEHGVVNIRARFCQTVAPPSIHPSGKPYRFIRTGPITQLPNLNELIAWLDRLSPSKAGLKPQGNTPRPIRPPAANSLVEAVKAAWPTAVGVFKHFGLEINQRQEPNGETRLLGHGGLMIAADDPAVWYNFSDEIGGSVIDAWGWQRFGSAFDRRRHFRRVLLEMAQAAGIDVAQFYRRGDERLTAQGKGDRQHWEKQYSNRWEFMRS